MTQSRKKRTLINPPGTEMIYENWQFSQAVRVDDTVWVSGQVGIGEDMQPAEVGSAQRSQ